MSSRTAGSRRPRASAASVAGVDLTVCFGDLSALLIVLIPHHRGDFHASRRQPNIVLITLSSTRSDRMGFLGSKAKLPRTSMAWRAKALIFERGLLPGSADGGLARRPSLPALIPRRTGSASSAPGWLPLCPSSLTCYGQVNIAQPPSSVRSRSIRKTDRLPALTADSLSIDAGFQPPDQARAEMVHSIDQQRKSPPGLRPGLPGILKARSSFGCI